ncbi:hypothetical protein KA119_00230 [Candidatus Gracilibacteria bacterium]|nr:hypothetical protein [Candidatus Gracilibacteria bacterium]
MAEKKIDLLTAALTEVGKEDAFDAGFEKVLERVGRVNADIAAKVQGATNLRPTAEKTFGELRQKGKTSPEALRIVLSQIYGKLFEPISLGALELGELDGIVTAHGNSPSLKKTLAALAGNLVAKRKGGFDDTPSKTALAAKGNELNGLTATHEKFSRIGDLLRKPNDDRSEKLLGEGRDLNEAVLDAKLQRGVYGAFASVEKLAVKLQGDAIFSKQYGKLHEAVKRFVELMDDKGDEKQLRIEWFALMKSLEAVPKVLDQINGDDYEPLVTEARDALDTFNDLNPMRNLGSDKHEAPFIPPNLRRLQGVIAFPEFAGEDRDVVFNNLQTKFDPIYQWLEGQRFGRMTHLRAWMSEYEKLKSKTTDEKSHNPGRPEIEVFLRMYFEGGVKKEIEALEWIYSFGQPGNAGEAYLFGLRNAKKVLGGLPDEAERFLNDRSDENRNVLNLYVADGNFERGFTKKLKFLFPRDTVRSAYRIDSKNASFSVEEEVVNKGFGELGAIHDKITDLRPLSTELEPLFESFSTAWNRIKDSRSKPGLEEFNQWLKDHYYPLRDALGNAVNKDARDYAEKFPGLTEEIRGLEEKIGDLGSPLRTALLRKMGKTDATDLELMAALLTEVGITAKVNDGKLQLFGEDPAKVLSENGRKRMLAALKKAQQALANCDKAELLSDGAKIEALDTSGINESLKKAIDSDSESPKDVVVSDTSALTDEVDRLTRLKKTIAAPTDPIPAMAASKNATKELLDGATADYNKRFKSHAELQNKLDGAIGQLQRAKEMATKLFVGLKPVCEGLKLAKSLGVSDKLLPKDSTGAPILDGILEKFNEVAAKEGVFSLADIGKLKKLFESLRDYLTGDTLNLLADSLDDSQKAIDSFGKNPDALAEALQKAALQLTNPSLTEEEASQGARAIKKADRLAASGVMTPEERADFLRAKRFDVNPEYIKWYKAVRFKRGDKEVSLESIVGDVADFNDLAKLGKLLATAKLKDHELAAIYVALRSAGGGVVNEQMKMIFETLVERALNDPAAKREAKKSKLSEQERLEAAQSYAKAQIAANEGESETSGFFERADSRAKENSTRNKAMFEIEAKLLNLQIAAEEIPKMDYEKKMTRLAKKYEQGVKGAKFYEFRWNKMKENAKTSAKAAVAAAPELLVRKTGALALKALGWGWNKTLGRNKLKVDTSNVAKFIGGSAKDIYNRDKEFIKKNISHAVEIEMLNEELEELKKEGEDAKRSMVVADEGIKAADFCIKASNDDVEVSEKVA